MRSKPSHAAAAGHCCWSGTLATSRTSARSEAGLSVSYAGTAPGAASRASTLETIGSHSASSAAWIASSHASASLSSRRPEAQAERSPGTRAGTSLSTAAPDLAADLSVLAVSPSAFCRVGLVLLDLAGDPSAGAVGSTAAASLEDAQPIPTAVRPELCGQLLDARPVLER